MDYSAKEIFLAALGSSGFIGGVVTVFVFITGRLDARRKRISDEKAINVSESVELQKLKIDAEHKGTEAVINNLWRIIEEQRSEITEYRKSLDDCEKGDKLTVRNVHKIFEHVRKIKNEMDSLNIMLLSDEETNVFARRWGNIKVIMADLEKTLSGDE